LSTPSHRFPLSLLSRLAESSRTCRLWLSRLIDFAARRERPRWIVRRVIAGWIERFGIDLDDFEVPADGFRTYRDFHARALRSGARRVDRESAAVFPADGFVLAAGPIRAGRVGQVKGIDYSLEELVNEGPPPFALDAYEGGTFVNLYLPVESCHRWYSPLDGRIRREKRLGGDLFALDLRSLASNAGIYAKNERLAQEVEGDGGVRLLLVAVGGIAATNVFSNSGGAAERVPCVRGQELGGFYLGSSIVILLPRGTEPVPLAPRQPVRMGQPLVPARQPVAPPGPAATLATAAPRSGGEAPALPRPEHPQQRAQPVAEQAAHRRELGDHHAEHRHRAILEEIAEEGAVE
jgi:phosphatidylserine decarboxylase